jgi:hypothetical protein
MDLVSQKEGIPQPNSSKAPSILTRIDVERLGWVRRGSGRTGACPGSSTPRSSWPDLTEPVYLTYCREALEARRIRRSKLNVDG